MKLLTLFQKWDSSKKEQIHRICEKHIGRMPLRAYLLIFSVRICVGCLLINLPYHFPELSSSFS